jgi:hypothetical protein
VIDSTNVYWVNNTSAPGAGTVLSAPLSGVPEGGAPTTLYSGSAGAALAIDSQHVYWAQNTGGEAYILGVPIGGGAVTTLGLGNEPTWLDVNGTNLYWANVGDGTIMAASLLPDAGPAVELASEGSSAFVFGVAANSSSVYWTNEQFDTISALPLDGGAMTTVASGTTHPYRIAVGSTAVYWTTGFPPSPLMTAPLGGEPDGGTATTLAVSGSSSASDLALDSTNVYWTDPLEGVVLSVPLTGGTVTTIASGQGEPGAVAVDSSYVYWANYQTGTIVKTPKN